MTITAAGRLNTGALFTSLFADWFPPVQHPAPPQSTDQLIRDVAHAQARIHAGNAGRLKDIPGGVDGLEDYIAGILTRFTATDSYTKLADQYGAWLRDPKTVSPEYTPQMIGDLTKDHRRQLEALAELACAARTGWLPPSPDSRAYRSKLMHDAGMTAADIKAYFQGSHHDTYVPLPEAQHAHLRTLVDDLASGRIGLITERPSVTCVEGNNHAMIKYKAADKTILGVPAITYALTTNDQPVLASPTEGSDIAVMTYGLTRAQELTEYGSTKPSPYDVLADEYEARYREAQLDLRTRFSGRGQDVAMADLADTISYAKDVIGSIADAYETDPRFKATYDAFIGGLDPARMPTPADVETQLRAAAHR